MRRVNEERAQLLSIGEFARRCGLSISALRFYGDCGVLLPARTDEATGYRYYTADQLTSAELIRHLRALEMPIAEIELFLAADSAAAQSLLDRHADRLRDRVHRNEVAMAAVHSLLGSKESRMSATTTVPGERLARAIREVLPAAGRLEKRDFPAAVLVELREDGLRLVATDGHRLAVRDLPSPTEETGRTVITVDDAARLATRVESAGKVTLTVAGSLSARTEGETFQIKAVSHHYPEYESILGRGGRSTLLVKIEDLNDRIAEQKDVIVLDLAADEASANGVRFEGRYKGDRVRIGFNPGYLAEAVGAAVGPDVILRFGGPLDPVIVRSGDDGTLTWLVMPIRLKEPSAR